VGGVTRAGAAALLVACAGLAAGCGERGEPTGLQVSLYPVTVTGAEGRPVRMERDARRVVVLTPAAARVLAAVGAGRTIVGAPAGAARRLSSRPLQVVDSRGGIRFGQLERLRPDVVVGSPLYSAADLRRAGEAAEAPVYVAPEGSIREVERAISDLGLIVGRPIPARRLVGRIEARRARVLEQLGAAPLVSVFVDTGFFTTVSDRSLIGDVIRTARGRNVAGPAPEPGPFDLDELVRRNPRVYVATSESETTLRTLRRNPKTKRLAAVRAGRFATVRAELLEPGPELGRGIAALTRILHPDVFR
jgi:ABC-type Fe3+-hydroxamate transport system substrate-binding protein